VRRESLTDTLLLCVAKNHLSSPSMTSLPSGFRNRCIFYPFRSNTIIIILVFFSQIFWIVEFTRPNSRLRSTFFFFSIFYFSYRCKFPFDAQNLPLFVTAGVLLSHYQSARSCRSRKEGSDLTPKVNYRWDLRSSRRYAA